MSEGFERVRLPRDFLWIWLGQVVSLLGSGMTTFGLGVWVLEETGSIIRFTVITTLAVVPGVLLSPLAGELVDRFDRKTMLVVSDTMAATATLAVWALLTSGRLGIAHLYPLVALASLGNALQFPAFAASMSLMVPTRHLVRANGLVGFGQAMSQILAPLAAGFLLAAIQLRGILLLDLATFAFSIAVLLGLVRIPAPPRTTPEAAEKSFWRRVGFGWVYLRQRPGLLRLLTYFAVLNLLLPFCMVLTTPLVLATFPPAKLGMVLATSALGSLAGGAVMSIWGGPEQKIYGILAWTPLMAVGLALAAWQPWLPSIAAGMFLVLFSFPILNSCSQAIWQSQVPPDVQGRVFATRRMIAHGSHPIAFLSAGPLAEKLFEPLMQPGGGLAQTFGPLLGTGPGRGIALLYLLLAGVVLATAAWGFTDRLLRQVEQGSTQAETASPETS